MSKIKQQRTAEQIQYILSNIFQRDLHDPRAAGVTITEVRIDRELQHVDVYVNALGDETREREVMAALRSAAGFLRRELAQRLPLRSVPLLHFRWDPSLAQAETVHEILDNLALAPLPEEPLEPERVWDELDEDELDEEEE